MLKRQNRRVKRLPQNLSLSMMNLWKSKMLESKKSRLKILSRLKRMILQMNPWR